MRIERNKRKGIIVENDELKILINPSPSGRDIDADYVVCTTLERIKDGIKVAKESDAILVSTMEVPRTDVIQIVPSGFQALGRGVWVGRLKDKLFLLIDDMGRGILMAEKSIMKNARDIVNRIYLGEISEYEI